MNDKKKALAFSALIPFLILLIQPAYAEPVKQFNYDLEFLGYNNQGDERYSFTSQPERIITWYVEGKPVYSNYRLYQDASTITLETMNAGSLVFNKNSCSYDIYPNGYVSDHTPKVKNISWTVKGKLSSSTTWSNVNAVNNAACNVSITNDERYVKITGQKTNTGGTFQVLLEYRPGQGIKETMRAYNNNPTWNNHHIGFTETFEVPQVIKFGGQQYDLANYNGTVLGRNWIESNEAKLVTLFDNYYYDFGIGFDNLEDIKITSQGGITKLSLNYLYTNQIVPYQQWFEVDPTFNQGVSHQKRVYAIGLNTDCSTGTGTNEDTTLEIGKRNDAGGCRIIWNQFNITSIPTDATVTSAYFEWDQTSTTNWVDRCGLYAYATQPNTLTIAQKYSQGWSGQGSGTMNTCTTDGVNKQINLNSTGIANLQANISGGEGWWGAMLQSADSAKTDGTSRLFVIADTKLNVVYTLRPPHAVTTLTASGQPSNSIILSWTAPNPGSAAITGYRINYTTPYGNPATILVNNTNGVGTLYTVGNLEERTQYSFRVAPWTTVGTNATGNIANATSGIRAGNFTIGFFNVNATNPLFAGIQFERHDLNTTHTLVNVTYDKDYTLRCTVASTFAQTSNTYNMSGGQINDDQRETGFTFIDHENDIISIDCWDVTTNDTGTYYLNQESGWVLLNMINNFRDGTYGTTGKFGAFDFVTFIVLILGMIGLNRVNEALGAIFMILAIGALGVLGIITLETGIVFGVIALAVMLAIVTTRKD